MDRRLQLIKRNKNAAKNLVKREQKSSYKFLIFFMIVGSLNYVFWHDQFLGLDFKHAAVFIVLPLILGLLIYYQMNKFFNKSVRDTKPNGIWNIILSNVFMVFIGLFFAYISAVTIADMIFKLSMDFSVNNKPVITKTYVVESTVKNSTGRRIHFFSYIYYLDEANKIHTYNVPVNDVETSFDKRKISFKCKEGFWGYYKIINYRIE